MAGKKSDSKSKDKGQMTVAETGHKGGEASGYKKEAAEKRKNSRNNTGAPVQGARSSSSPSRARAPVTK